MKDASITTEALYQGTDVRGMDLHPEAIPCFLTTAFTMKGFEEVQETYAAKGYTYVRTRNPNRTALGEIISCLEGGEASLIFSSGMGAITSTLLTVLKAGDHVICNANIYGETFSVMTDILKKFGVDVTFADYQIPGAAAKAIRPETKLIYSEVLSNPTLTLVDLKAMADLAHENGALLMVDNTFTTPIAIRPMDFGADIVINSLTKFLNGHSDAMGGSVTTSQELCDRIQPLAMLLGTPGDPFSSWLIQRGVSTASVRLPRQMHNAEQLAAALARNPHVSKVNHPSLPDHPDHALYQKYFPNGGGSIFTFEIKGGQEEAHKFIDSLEIFSLLANVADVKSLVIHPATTTHSQLSPEELADQGIKPNTIRLSIGTEHIDDIIADLEKGFAAVK